MSVCNCTGACRRPPFTCGGYSETLPPTTTAFPCPFCGNAKMKDEIDRLRIVNAEILTALKRMRGITWEHVSPACDAADAAIAKAETKP